MVSNRQESPNLDNQFQLLARRSIKLPFPHHLIIKALLGPGGNSRASQHAHAWHWMHRSARYMLHVRAETEQSIGSSKKFIIEVVVARTTESLCLRKDPLCHSYGRLVSL